MNGSCGSQEGAADVTFERYSNKDPECDVTLDRISEWRHSAARGAYEPYTQVVFYEPARPGKKIKAEIVLTIADSSKSNVTPTLEGMKTDLLARRQELDDEKVLSESPGKLGDLDTVLVELSYKNVDSLNNLNASLVPMREKVLMFMRGGKFYYLRYMNTEDDFAQFDAAFSRIVQSLRFKDGA